MGISLLYFCCFFVLRLDAGYHDCVLERAGGMRNLRVPRSGCLIELAVVFYVTAY